jgi:hypothetical protein
MRFRQMVVAVVHVIVTAGQYIGRASGTSTTRESGGGPIPSVFSRGPEFCYPAVSPLSFAG